MRRRIARYIFPALIVLMPACAAIALPVARMYAAGDSALNEPDQSEAKAFQRLQEARAQRGLAPVKWDGALSAVAREHSRDMAENDYFEYASPRLGTIEYRLHRAGISAPNVRYAIFSFGSVDGLVPELERQSAPFHAQPMARLGIGIVSAGLGKGIRLTLIAVEKDSELDPFPTQPPLPSEQRLAGRMRAGLSNAEVIVTLPNGSTEGRPLSADAAGRFDTRLPFRNGPGLYMVEITASDSTGPRVLELLNCYCGVPYPAPAAPAPKTATPADLREAERMVYAMILNERAQYGLGRLRYDDSVAGVAREHSRDMFENKFFAHVSPTKGDLERRMAARGIKARAFTENIASNKDLAAAHADLMQSPGHRKNILSPDMNAVGIGVVMGDDNQLFITENFTQDFPTYDLNALGDKLVSDLNALRIGGRLPALRVEPRLSRVARENSAVMLETGATKTDKAQTLLKELHLPYGVWIGTYLSGDPPAADQLKEALANKYRSIGVGISQSASVDAGKPLYITILLGER